MNSIIKKIGKSKGIVFPPQILDQIGLDLDDKIDIEIIDNYLVIKPIYPLRESEQDRNNLNEMFTMQRDSIFREERLYQLEQYILANNKEEFVYKNKYSDSYLYAWQERVYPFLHDIDDATIEFHHQFYTPCFYVSKEQVDFLIQYFDEVDLNDQLIPSLHHLEHQFIKIDKLGWTKMKLVKACRYLYLNGMFDDHFWGQLLIDCPPSEARSITKQFNRNER